MQSEVLRGGELTVERRVLEHEADLPADVVGAGPGDGVCLLTLDPATLLPTGEYVENWLPPAATPRLGEIECHESDFNKFVDLARRPVPAASLSAATGGDLDRSRRQRELRRPSGFGDELRAALGDSSGTWAALTLLRERGRPAFTGTDVVFLASMAGILAEGVRRSLLTGARPAGGDSFADGGLLVLAPDGSLETADRDGDRWLGLLGDDGQARRDDSGELATARVRTTRGQWVVVRGSVLGVGADARVAIRLEPARPPQLAPLLVAAYGLTPREREVTELVARGHATGEIAALLEITTYTVQDHLKAIFEKSGTGSRGELVAQLFIDGFRPNLTISETAKLHTPCPAGGSMRCPRGAPRCQDRSVRSFEPEEMPPAMAKLIYSAITSLDGYVEDEDGNFDWADPDEELLAFVNDLERPIGTYLYGRRMYETMVGWETMEFLGDRHPLMLDFAGIWRAADKIVFSRSLEAGSSAGHQG